MQAKSDSRRAGLIFPVSYALRRHNQGNQPLRKDAAIYLTAVAEYLIAELLESVVPSERISCTTLREGIAGDAEMQVVVHTKFNDLLEDEGNKLINLVVVKYVKWPLLSTYLYLKTPEKTEDYTDEEPQLQLAIRALDIGAVHRLLRNDADPRLEDDALHVALTSDSMFKQTTKEIAILEYSLFLRIPCIYIKNGRIPGGTRFSTQRN
jgi:hypothetical protein